MHEFRTRRKIEFADTDMAGIVHFARFMVFMETAEHEFLEAIGTNVSIESDGKQLGWPRVQVACQYSSPARFGDCLDIHLRVVRKGVTSMTYGFTFERDGTLIATGEVRTVCCELGADGKLCSIPIPAAIADKIEEVPQ